jgi:GNAT superfamily N-acetyltransferase
LAAGQPLVYRRLFSDGGGVVDVHTLQLDAINSAAPVIARAFHDDTLSVYLYPDENERSRLAPLMFDALVRYDCLFGQVDYLEGFTAVATWVRPGDTAETPERLSAAGFDELPDDIPLERLDTFFAAIAPLHGRAVPRPHWYLRLLGVDRVQQGRGLGGALLQHGLRRADADGHPCYLETFSERNVPFYLRHGFDLVVDDVEPASGIRTWGFLRDP